MNKKEWRDRLLTIRAWNADTTKNFSSELDDVLNLALSRLASDVPAAIIPDIDHLVVNKDFSQSDFGRGISTTTDPYVLTLGLSGTLNPTTDGTWNGIYDIEFQDSSGNWHRRKCREFWQHKVEGAFYDHYLVSLDRPIQSSLGSFTGVNFRLSQTEFFFHDDVMEVVYGQIHDPEISQIIPLPESFSSYMEHDNIRGSVVGRPQYVARSRHYHLEAPMRAPVVAAGQQNTWVGPEPIGTFEYVFTYCWGYRDDERQSDFGRFDPLWESAPSPVSVAATVTAGSVILTLPEIDWQLNFGDNTTLRYGRSGIYKRVYRRRSVTGATPSHPTIEAPSIYQMMTDVSGEITTFTDNGTVIPDYSKRLPESHGYYAYRNFPHQDRRYEMDWRVRRRPKKLVNDQDVPPIHVDCHDALIELGLYYLSLMDRQQTDADTHLQRYLTLHLPKIKAQYANPARIIPGLPWFVQNYPNRRFTGLRFGPMSS
jgi:hypothetical protein